jgi:hypothetical protein
LTTTPLKKRSAPVITQDLRRRKRIMSANKGYKHPSFFESNGKKQGKVISMCSSTRKSKVHSFNFASEFLDLAYIDKMTANGIHRPQISIFQLHKVGQEVCGLQPSEVAVDKLL